MRVFLIQLLSIIFVLLITGSIQSVTADHLEPGIGIFKDKTEVELVTAQDSNYQVYLQTVLRNGDGQLISVTEGSIRGYVVPHKVTDHIFDTLMGKKEIVTIDNMKYEKVQYVFNPTHKEKLYSIFPIFSENPLPPVDHIAAHEKMHEKNLEVSSWRNNYCTTFKEHGYDCVPIFQVLAPSLTLEPHNVMNQQWTILRELN